MPKSKTILVAPLNWGLGHSTRCVPIIQALSANGFEVILASDGAALLLLQKEFPTLEYIELPSYNIEYPKNGRYFKWKLLLNFPQIRRAITSEKKIVRQLVEEGRIQGIISDCRFGIRSDKIPSVFITHQLNVLTGSTSFLSSTINHALIKKYDSCWVPDSKDALKNLSGKLGHPIRSLLPVEYIGILSRMQKKNLPLEIDILVLLSGPEPQRSLLELKMMDTLQNIDKRILLVQGKVAEVQKVDHFNNIKVVNFLTSEALEDAINKSEIVIARSGYSTIMDLAVLGKKAFFIPTPGQYEQEYLAKRLDILGIAPYCRQDKFMPEELEKIHHYKGFDVSDIMPNNFSRLFSLFEGK